MATKDWQALARVVRDRRKEMRLNQADLEERGGPGEYTVRDVERASRENFSGRTLRSLERALHFQDGLLNQVLDGAVKEGSPELSTYSHRAAARGSASTSGGSWGSGPAWGGTSSPPGPAASLVSDSTVTGGGQTLDGDPAHGHHTAYDGDLEFEVTDEARSDNALRVDRVPAPQTIAPEGRPSQVRAGRPSVRQHPPSFARRRVTLDGTILGYASALSPDAHEVARLPDRFLPILAALAALEEVVAAGVDQYPPDKREGLEIDLVAAKDALTIAVASLADATEPDARPAETSDSAVAQMFKAVLSGSTTLETLSLSTGPEPGWADWHVEMAGERWQVNRRGAGRPAATEETKAKAIKAARYIAERNSSGRVLVHDGTEEIHIRDHRLGHSRGWTVREG